MYPFKERHKGVIHVTFSGNSMLPSKWFLSMGWLAYLGRGFVTADVKCGG